MRRQSTGLTFRDDPDRDAFGFWAVESTLAVSYRAGLAIGRAGLFRADGTLSGRRVTGGGWIVLADGQERGGILRPRTFTPMPIPNPRISSGSTVSVSGGILTAQRITTP